MASSKHKSLCPEDHDILEEPRFLVWYCKSLPSSMSDNCLDIGNDSFKTCRRKALICMIMLNIICMLNIILAKLYSHTWWSFFVFFFLCLLEPYVHVHIHWALYIFNFADLKVFNFCFKNPNFIVRHLVESYM